MLPTPPLPPTPRIPTLLALLLMSTLVVATPSCVRTQTRTVTAPWIPCLVIPPPVPPPVGASDAAMSAYRAQLTGYAWAAFDACGPSPSVAP